MDFLASLAMLTGQKLLPEEAPDSIDILSALTEESTAGRQYLVQEAIGGHLSLRKDDWKYIAPGAGEKLLANKSIESGRDPEPQLYQLHQDPGEMNNVAQAYPEILTQMQNLLEKIRQTGHRLL